MKLMYFIPGLSIGGAETLVKDYALNINRKLFDVVVLCINHSNDSPYEKILENANVRVIYISVYLKQNYKGKSIFKPFNKVYNFIKRFYLVKNFIRQEKPEVLHIHLPINKYIRFAKPNKKTKMFYTLHGDVKRYQHLYNYDFKAIKWLIKKYNMSIICLHDKMRREVNDIFKINNTIVLKNGIDFSKFEKRKTKTEMRKILNIKNDLFVIGHVGRFNKVKNHGFLVNIFKEVYKKNNNSFLLLIGDGEEKSEIITMLHEYKLDNNYMILSNRIDLPDLLNTMDVFVFPSISEGMPLSLIEAQEAKLPCFISDKITNEAIISNLVTQLPIDSGINSWVNELCNINKVNDIYLNDKGWDIKQVVKKLEKIYLKEE